MFIRTYIHIYTIYDMYMFIRTLYIYMYITYMYMFIRTHIYICIHMCLVVYLFVYDICHSFNITFRKVFWIEGKQIHTGQDVLGD